MLKFVMLNVFLHLDIEFVMPIVFLHLYINIHMPNVLQFIWILKLSSIINRRMPIHLPEKKFNILALITPHKYQTSSAHAQSGGWLYSYSK